VGRRVVAYKFTRCIAAVLTASIAGCGTVRDLASCRAPDSTATSQRVNQPSPGATIILATGRYDPPITIDDQFADGNYRPRGAFVSNPVSGTAVGAASGAGACAVLLPLPPLFFACVPVGMAAGAVAGAAAGTKGALEDEEQQIAKRQRTFDEQTANRNAAGQRVAASVESVDLNRLLLERVRQDAKESGVGNLAELPGQGPQSPDDLPEYRTEKDFVLEVTLIERTVIATGYTSKPLYSLGLTARGRLIRVADNATVYIFTTHAETAAKTGEEWAANNGALYAAELNSLTQQIAKTAADQWIRTAIDTAYDASATVVLIWPEHRWIMNLSQPIAIDGCFVGELDYKSFLEVKTSAGKHTLTAEKLRLADSNFNYYPYELETKPREIIYVEYIVEKGWAGFTHIHRESAEQFIRTLKNGPSAFPDGRRGTLPAR